MKLSVCLCILLFSLSTVRAQTRPSIFETTERALNSAISSANTLLDSSGLNLKPWKVNIREFKDYIISSDTTRFKDLLVTFNVKRGLFTKKVYFSAIAANRIGAEDEPSSGNRAADAFSSLRGDGILMNLDKIRSHRLRMLDRAGSGVNVQGMYLTNREVLTMLDQYSGQGFEELIVTPVVNEEDSEGILNMAFRPQSTSRNEESMAIPAASFSRSDSGCPPFRCDF